MAYDMGDQFIIPTVVDEFAGAVEFFSENRATAGVNLLYHWSKVLFHLVSQFQRDPYKNCDDNEEIVICEWTKDLFIKSSDPALIKWVE